MLPVGFVPKIITMSPSHFIACNERTVYSWQFVSVSQNIENAYKRSDDNDEAEAGKYAHTY